MFGGLFKVKAPVTTNAVNPDPYSNSAALSLSDIEAVKSEMRRMQVENSLSKGWLSQSLQPHTMEPTHAAMVAMRLRIPQGAQWPFQRFDVWLRKDGTPIALVMMDDEIVTIEDDPGLFPSDKLITKLRTMMGK